MKYLKSSSTYTNKSQIPAYGIFMRLYVVTIYANEYIQDIYMSLLKQHTVH